MKTMAEVSRVLRRKNIKNYLLLVMCSFFSVLLITAYVTMMKAPTVLEILPVGGDSRKQMMGIFALALVGCSVFTAYAASLFFRYKSRETGIFMALGASRKQISREIFKELALISIVSCGAGALLGTPFASGIWNMFRMLLVDTKEMALRLDPQAYLYAGAFSLFTILCFFFMAVKFINRTNIIDIVNEQRKSEPIHDIKPWCGYVGIALIIIGFFLGYFAPVFFIRVLYWYPPEWMSIITYSPLFAGLYMTLLHTIIRGWRKGKNRYKDIIGRSMMKFQGRQTVNNMLVITLLVAGALFAVFYVPSMGVSAFRDTNRREIDYLFHYRADQNMLTRSDIEQIAQEENVNITKWNEVEFANIAYDGEREVDKPDRTYIHQYETLLAEGNFISETNYNIITGQSLDVEKGKFMAVLTAQGTGGYMISVDITLLTNPVTGETMPIEFGDYVGYDQLATKYYVLDDSDYTQISKGLNDMWKENLVAFNVADRDESYHFAKRLYNGIIDHTSSDCEVEGYYDRIAKAASDKRGEIYWGDTANATKISFAGRESSEFKINWKYMPQFAVLDANDFMSNYAVFLMTFLFIAIICFAAVIVIAYTRCLTIAINNKQMYDDLKHLGASPRYLYNSVRGQMSKVYTTPIAIGATVIYLFYAMIMYANDGLLVPDEIAGLAVCFVVGMVIIFGIWLFYRFNLKKVCAMLEVHK